MSSRWDEKWLVLVHELIWTEVCVIIVDGDESRFITSLEVIALSSFF